MSQTKSVFVRRLGLALALLGVLSISPSWAATPKEGSSLLDSKEFFRPELYISSTNMPLAEALPQLENRAAWDGLHGPRVGRRHRRLHRPAVGRGDEHHRLLPAHPRRRRGQDSRYWGFLPGSYVKGKALFVYWSYDAGREGAQEEGMGATARRLLSVVTHFFTRTRWDRLLHQIR